MSNKKHDWKEEYCGIYIRGWHKMIKYVKHEWPRIKCPVTNY